MQGVREDSVSGCEMSFYAETIKNHFATKLPENKGIDLHDKKLTPRLLMKKLNVPVELCGYCHWGG